MNVNKNLNLFGSEQLVTIQNGQAVTSSLQIAQVFQKNHKDVLKAIRELESSPQFKERNFSPSFYISELHNGGQKKQPMYYLTKDGFTFLVMGFTGKLAAKFKEDYINAFNQMEAHIKHGNIDEKRISDYIKIKLIESKKGIRENYKALSIKHGVDLSGGELAITFWSESLDLKSNIDNLISAYRNNIASSISLQYRSYLNEIELKDTKSDLSALINSLYHKYCY